MRISVECGGFTRAADACLTANHVAALLTQSLGSRLATTGGMAGDDATSADFATAYDDGAAEALATLADLTHAFAGAGRLLAATGDNHERAEAAAAQVPYDGSTALDDDAFALVRPPSPPSSLGGQEPSLGVVDAWILDRVEGFVWPGADVDALAAAASAWRSAAATTARLADHVDVAITLLEAQRSPEVPLAIDALTELVTLVGDTAWQLSTLATACEEYAAAVEAARERARALLAEVGQMIVEGAAISVIAAGLSGGLGGGAAAAAAAARVRAAAPRFYALLVTLRAGVATAAGRLERARDELSEVRSKLDKFLRVPARNEAGTMKQPGGWLPGREAFADKQLRKKYKHAGVFGVEGPYTTANASRFAEALRRFVASDSVVTKVGTMRGQPGPVVFHYDPESRRCVAMTEGGDFVSGWKLSPGQLAGVIAKGHLGGS